MSGIKLTVLLPVINQLIREVAGNQSSQYVAILCHSVMRCQEIEAFLKELVTFCNDVVEIVDLYSGEKIENSLRLK
jgi:hypothetical protein